MKPIIMTSSGTRFVVGENFSPDLATKTGIAFGTYLKSGTVIVGGDTRTSHDMVKYAVISGLLSVGIDVIDIGKAPTPTHQQMIKKFKADGAVVITASHNPVVWNGIKLMGGAGSFLTAAEFDEFKAIYDQTDYQLNDWSGMGQITHYDRAIDDHIDFILETLDTSSISGSGLKVLVDANNGTGSLADFTLLDRLGVEYEILNGEPDGKFAHDPEPLQQNLTQILDAMKTSQYDIGFIQDADADRLVIIDEKGRFIGEDYSFGLCVDYLLGHTDSESKTVAVNISTSRVIADISSRHSAELHYTKIGETHVTEKLKALNATVGGEGNGGVIYPKIGWGRDSLVGIVVALKYLAESKKSVSQIVSTYPQYTMLRDKAQVASRDDIDRILADIRSKYADQPMDELDGIRVDFDDAWFIVRPSNTEPIVRYFVEATTTDAAKALLNDIKH